MVLEAVKQKGCALEYASAELKSDKEVVMTAVIHDGGALEYASEELYSGVALNAFVRALLNDRRRFELLLMLAGPVRLGSSGEGRPSAMPRSQRPPLSLLNAHGPGSDMVKGFMDNTDVFKVMVNALGLARTQ